MTEGCIRSPINRTARGCHFSRNDLVFEEKADNCRILSIFDPRVFSRG